MNILAISDMHGELVDIPECDLLLIAGDVCPAFHSKKDSIEHQSTWIDEKLNPWLNKQPAKEIVMVAGNHDWIFAQEDKPEVDCIYLENTTITIDGYTIYGCPWSLHFNDWAFNCGEQDFRIMLDYDLLQESDIWLFHSPMLGHGDLVYGGEHIGSHVIRELYDRIKPKLYVFGHNHVPYINEDRNIIGATLLDDFYEYVNEPRMINL